MIQYSLRKSSYLDSMAIAGENSGEQDIQPARRLGQKNCPLHQFSNPRSSSNQIVVINNNKHCIVVRK